jgi:addiction module HigA family antidote
MLRAEFLEPLGLTQTEAAERLGIPLNRLNEIVRGKRGVTPDTVLRLERLLGMEAAFWLNLQTGWDLYHAMRAPTAAEILRIRPVRRVASTQAHDGAEDER